ncbi:MAG TPA: MBL fold metallo-hydrolase [Solirubrobacteraceae bacterium]|jgi:glyoxylase-like metal-dependent hydrolase (beta-lactamase superfamily II)
MLTVGMVAENTFIARRDGGDRAILIDPGDEPERIARELASLGVTVDAILLTHTHFDHVGAVAAMARQTGAPVHCPKGEAFILADINRFQPFPGIGPFESYDAEVLVSGGDRLELAGFAIDVVSTPGHSPDHVTYVLADEGAVFSGDVLFQGSIGRTDLPGADHDTLMASISTLLGLLPDDTVVHPGHMGTTTLGRERRTNPFLRELAARG